MNNHQKNSLALLFSYRFIERIAFFTFISILMKMLNTLAVDNSPSDYAMIYSFFYTSIGISAILSGILGDLKNRQKIVVVGFIIVLVSAVLITLLTVQNLLGQLLLIPLGVGFGMIGVNTIVLLGDIYNEKVKEIKGLPGFVFHSLILDIASLIGIFIGARVFSEFGFEVVMIVVMVEMALALLLLILFKKNFEKINFHTISNTSTYESTNHKYLNGYILSATLILAFVFSIISNQKSLIVIHYLNRSIIDPIFSLSLREIDKLFSILFLVVFFVFILLKKRLNWKVIYNILAISALIYAITYAFLALINISHLFKLDTISSLSILTLLVIAGTLLYSTISYAIYRSAPRKNKGLFQGTLHLIHVITGSFLSTSFLIQQEIGTNWLYVFFTIIALGLVFITLKVIRSIDHKKN